MAAVPFFLPLDPFFQSVVVCMAAGSLLHEASGSAFQICLVLKKCYSKFSSVNRNIVSYCLSLCIDRNVTGYFTPSWSVHKVIRKSANYTRDRTGHIETVPHVLSFCAVFWWICIGMLTNFICRIASWVFYLFLLCFSHCEACVISFLQLAHRSHLMIFRLHLIFRLSSIKSVCSSPDSSSFHDLPFAFTDFLQRSSDSLENYYKTLFSTLATCEIVQRIVFASFERCDSCLESHFMRKLSITL